MKRTVLLVLALMAAMVPLLASAQSAFDPISAAVDFSGVTDAGIAIAALVAGVMAVFWGIRKVLSLLG